MRSATKNAASARDWNRPLRSSMLRGGGDMHILIVIIGGLAALGLFYLGYRFAWLNPAAGAVLFIWVWLSASVLNGLLGGFKAGIPVIQEIAAFILILGLPGVAAWESGPPCRL